MIVVEGTKTFIIWESNNEPPKSYIWVKPDNIPYEYDPDLKEWVVCTAIDNDHTARVVVKTTEEWNERSWYIPSKGQIIVYSDYKQEEKDGQLVDIPGIKIGNRVLHVQDLPFVGDDKVSLDLTELSEGTLILEFNQ